MGCPYEILAHNSNGYILSCNGCGHYQLAFGTTEINLLPEALQQFRHRLQRILNETPAPDFPNQKTIRVPLEASNIQLALTPGEAGQLLALVDEAAATSAYRRLMEEMEWK